MKRWIKRLSDGAIGATIVVGGFAIVVAVIALGVALMLGIRVTLRGDLGDVLLGGILVWAGIIVGLAFLDSLVNDEYG
jgi:hypothetical protein